MNGKSSILETAREKLPLTGSSFRRKECEVHPGVDPVNPRYARAAGYGVVHVTCEEWKDAEEKVSFYESGTAELFRLLCECRRRFFHITGNCVPMV